MAATEDRHSGRPLMKDAVQGDILRKASRRFWPGFAHHGCVVAHTARVPLNAWEEGSVYTEAKSGVL
jgi:hypothetical protein